MKTCKNKVGETFKKILPKNLLPGRTNKSNKITGLPITVDGYTVVLSPSDLRSYHELLAESWQQ